MIKNINLQFLISYLGLLPFLIAIVDKFFFHYLSTNIVDDFIIIYSLIIFVFIGAINWDLKKRLPVKLVITGFLPSLIGVHLASALQASNSSSITRVWWSWSCDVNFGRSLSMIKDDSYCEKYSFKNALKIYFARNLLKTETGLLSTTVSKVEISLANHSSDVRPT